MHPILSRTLPGLLVTLLSVVPGAGSPAPARAEAPDATTTTDLFGWPAPYALGHRGYGANRGEDPSRPLENTLDGIHAAFRDGIRIVELDLQRTADGKVVVFHDEFLADFTCVSSLTFDELRAREPQVPLFRAVLNSSRHFSRAGAPSGLFLAEIKVPVPMCDGANTSAQAVVSETELVAAVIDDIRRAGMEQQVVLNSGSPSILSLARAQAPEIARALTLNVLQLLPPAFVAQIVNLPVTQIPRNECGLNWYNVGPIARLPSYYCATSPNCAFQSFVATAVGCAGATAVSVDKTVLLQAGPAAQALVAAMHGAGLEVIVWTADTASEWQQIATTGADGITTNNIALGLANQAAISSPAASSVDSNGRTTGKSLIGSGEPVSTEPSSAVLQATPAHDGSIRVRWNLPDGSRARLDVLDVAGRAVDSRTVGGDERAHEVSVGQSLPRGVYFVRLVHDSGEAHAKVAVTR